MLAEIQHRLLDFEQAIDRKMGKAMGWTNPSQRDRSIAKALAMAITSEGISEVEVQDFKLRLKSGGTDIAMKVVDFKHTSLDYFWDMVSDVRGRIGGWGSPTPSDELLLDAVRQTIADKKSGALDERAKKQWEERRSLDYLYDDL